MASSSSSASSPQQYRSRFGDTTWTKVFVGGLAWETPTEELRRHFEPFGDILEAVIISDKATGRSKGYGFVTFRDPEAAQRAVADQNPVIDGRRANCNIASMGRPRTSPRQQGRSQQEGSSMPQGVGPTHGRLPAHVAPQVIYPTAYGYMASYPSEYGYQQAAVYSAQMAAAPPYYYPQLYSPTTSPTNVAGPSPFQHHHYPNLGLGFPMQSPRAAAAFPSPPPAPRPPPLMHHLPADFFQLHAPPHAMPPPPPPPLNSTALEAQREPSSTSTGGADHTDDNRDA